MKLPETAAKWVNGWFRFSSTSLAQERAGPKLQIRHIPKSPINKFAFV
jgi:hypothetical protein